MWIVYSCFRYVVMFISLNIPQDVLSEKLRRHGTESPFVLFMKSETSRMTESLRSIHSSLQELSSIIFTSSSPSPPSKSDSLVDAPHMAELCLALLTLSAPQCWLDVVGPSAPPSTWPLKEWIQDLVLRYTFLDRVLAGGLAKTPTYWLGAFFNPQTFLSLVQQVQELLCWVCCMYGCQLTSAAFYTPRLWCGQCVWSPEL